MKRRVLTLLLIASPLLAFGQMMAGEGIQLSGTFSANLIDDIQSATAYADNNSGNTFLQLDAALHEGVYGFESQLQFGPAPATGGVNNFYFKYGYGYAYFLDSALYVAVGRFMDLSSFGLSSYYQGGGDGPGVYGNHATTAGSGFGVDGVEVRIAPASGLLIGLAIPYQETAVNLLNGTLGSSKLTASYTIEKTLQLVAGYSFHLTGVADMLTPITILNHNKLYLLANLLAAQNITAGARYELDHDVSALQVLSNNAYLTLGASMGDFTIGGDAGLYFPTNAQGGLELLGSTAYTFKNLGPSVSFQPYLSVAYFTSAYPAVYPELFATGTQNMIINPQLRLLLGKSQHQLTLGYTLTWDFSQRQATVDQLNLMLQLYF